MNKEVSDALYMLLHCALKDKEFETQKEQFDIVYKYIEELHSKIDKAIEYIENADWYLPLWEIRDNQPDKNILLEILKDSDVDE